MQSTSKKASGYKLIEPRLASGIRNPDYASGLLKGMRGVFLVWTVPGSSSSRSHSFARELGIGEPDYFYLNIKRSKGNAPIRYIYYAVESFRLLLRKRPQVVFVQNPPSFASLVAAVYCELTGSRFVMDSHTDALSRKIWNWPPFLYRYLARRAAATIVTDEYFRQKIEARGGRALVIKDPVTRFTTQPYPVEGEFSVAVVNTFNFDEPTVEVVEAARQLPHVRFYITGKTSKASPELLESAPSNVVFTGYLPSEQYYGLLESCSAVMSLTTRDHTFQCGANEGLSLARPVITSDWQILRSYFNLGTVHVDNSAGSIAAGVRGILSDLPRYQKEIEELRRQRRIEWQAAVEELVSLLN